MTKSEAFLTLTEKALSLRNFLVLNPGLIENRLAQRLLISAEIIHAMLKDGFL